MKNKIKIFFPIILIFIIIFNFDTIIITLRENLPHTFKVKVKKIFFGKKYLDEIAYYRKLGYNVKIFPKTQFENLETKKYLLEKLDIVEKTHYGNVTGLKQNVKKFFIENFNKGLVIVSAKGKIFILKDFQIQKSQLILSNLDNFEIKNVLDIAKIKDKLFISTVFQDPKNNNCSKIKILQAKFNEEKLIFKSFFNINECTKGTNALGGRIVYYKFKDKDGILYTTAASDSEKELAQDQNSLFGKILFLSLDGNEKLIFSKGHRNPQGLIVHRGKILSTEHGAYGGDEINKINYGKNYGHPVASYGDIYDFEKVIKERSDFRFTKNHSTSNFEEPIFSFIPSIGISEITNVPNGFSKYWQNNFLITSLNGRSVYRVEFDEQLTKIKYIETIHIGERIRDIKYIKNINSFVLALEETGSLLFLKANNS